MVLTRKLSESMSAESQTICGISYIRILLAIMWTAVNDPLIMQDRIGWDEDAGTVYTLLWLNDYSVAICVHA